MSLRLFAMSCGWLESDLRMFLAGERGAIRVPVPAWLILHDPAPWTDAPSRFEIV